MADGDESQERERQEREVHERLALPLLVPAAAFLFAILVIYGLSRIYLDLNEYAIGDVTMATPAAIGASVIILLSAWYLATTPRVPRWQVASIGALVIVLLTGGAIWAAVNDEESGVEFGQTETPVANGGPPTGSVLVGLVDPVFAVTVDPLSFPSGQVTFSVTNDGGQVHNLRIIKTDLAPDALPIDESGFEVDESQVNVVASIGELVAGSAEELSEELQAGAYVLICNIPTHYELGMRAGLTLE